MNMFQVWKCCPSIICGSFKSYNMKTLKGMELELVAVLLQIKNKYLVYLVS